MRHDAARRPGPITLDPTVAAQCAKQGVPSDFQFGFAQQRTRIGGNPNLNAETAKVATGGLVYEPPAVKGLGVTLDYFRVQIDKAVQSLGANVILANCYQRGLDDYCDQVVRTPDFSIDFINDPVDNVGRLTTSGVDFAVGYAYKLGGSAGRGCATSSRASTC